MSIRKPKLTDLRWVLDLTAEFVTGLKQSIGNLSNVANNQGLSGQETINTTGLWRNSPYFDWPVRHADVQPIVLILVTII